MKEKETPCSPPGKMTTTSSTKEGVSDIMVKAFTEEQKIVMFHYFLFVTSTPTLTIITNLHKQIAPISLYNDTDSKALLTTWFKHMSIFKSFLTEGAGSNWRFTESQQIKLLEYFLYTTTAPSSSQIESLHRTIGERGVSGAKITPDMVKKWFVSARANVMPDVPESAIGPYIHSPNDFPKLSISTTQTLNLYDSNSAAVALSSLFDLQPTTINNSNTNSQSAKKLEPKKKHENETISRAGYLTSVDRRGRMPSPPVNRAFEMDDVSAGGGKGNGGELSQSQASHPRDVKSPTVVEGMDNKGKKVATMYPKGGMTIRMTSPIMQLSKHLLEGEDEVCDYFL